MHELAITQNILDIALEQAKAIPASKITKINLTIGESSGVGGECVQFYFDFLSKDSIADKATLCFEFIPTQLRCRDCLFTFSTRFHQIVSGLNPKAKIFELSCKTGLGFEGWCSWILDAKWQKPKL